MAAGWKKIILTDEKAHLAEVTASQGIQLSNLLTPSTNDDYKVVVADEVTGDLKLRDQSDVGSEGSSVNAFTTFFVGGPSYTSLQPVIQNDALYFTSSLGNPLTISGDQSNLSITASVATQSKETVEDLSSLLLSASNLGTTDVHENITINYDDTAGTFSITGNTSLLLSNSLGQTGVTMEYNPVLIPANIYQLKMSASGLDLDDNVIFADITASSELEANGQGNISQTSNLTVGPAHPNYNNPQQNGEGGDWISSSLLHIVNDAGINNDLTMSGDFIFQGFVFDDAQVLVHSGSNVFGSGSMPTALANSHEFTGSLLITGSGITLQQSNSFNGDGSGLTNLSLSSIEGLGLLSGSSQIASEISGAFQFIAPTLRTASPTDGTVSAMTSSVTTVTTGYTGLSSGKQIWTFQSASDSDFLDDIAAEYITYAISSNTSGLDIVTTGTIGGTDGSITQTIALNISKSVEETLVGEDFIMFRDNANVSSRKIPVNNLAAFITASSAGTVTSISAGNGIFVTHGTGYDGTTVVDTTIDILLSGSEGSVSNNASTITVDDVGGHTLSNLIIEGDNDLGLNPLLNITKITTTGNGAFSYLKVTDPDSLTNLETEVVNIKDNFMYLNGDLGEVNPAIAPINDAGISLNRGNLNDANLFWDEGVARWALSKANLQAEGTIESTPDSYLVPVQVTAQDPGAYPSYGVTNDGNYISDTAAVGQIHVNTNATEVWIYA